MKLHMQDNSATLIDNTFIDRYMATANGEFVKLYLYLLRCVGSGRELSISSIADFFDHTEKDVRRALSYWEKLNLLKLKYDDGGSITDIVFCPGQTTEETEVSVSGSLQEPEIPTKRSLTTPRKKQLREEEDIRQLIFVAETYFGRVLTSTEITNLMYYYDTLHFSFELIEYLIEYCASKGNPGPRYMEKVALEWYRDGISTVGQAKKQSSQYSRDYYQIFAALGIQGRAPAPKEIEYMDRWLRVWSFPFEIILEACERTIMQTHQPSFSYADGILKKWHEQEVSSLADIEALDREHEKTKEYSRQKAKSDSVTGSKVSNRFNNFRQRDYDFTILERQLLQAQTAKTGNM